MLEGLRAENGGGGSSREAAVARGTRSCWTGDATSEVRARCTVGGAAAVPDAPGKDLGVLSSAGVVPSVATAVYATHLCSYFGVWHCCVFGFSVCSRLRLKRPRSSVLDSILSI